MATKPISDGYITSPYGWRKNPFNNKREFHAGIDISSHTPDAPVVAAYDGVVSWIDSTHPVYDPKTGKGSFGNVVYVKRLSDGYYTTYPHLKNIDTALKIGLSVTEGMNIGIMGNTGYSKGAHLHFENRKTMGPGNSKDPKEISDLYSV